jgi:serine protease Do
MQSRGGSRSFLEPRMRRAAAAAALLLAAALTAGGCAPYASDRGSIRITSFAPLVQQVMPAVVNVSAVQKPQKAASLEDMPGAAGLAGNRRASGSLSALDELLRKFFEERQHRGGPNLGGLALGSGFVIDPRGYIVTDNHVLENADSVTVTFHDGSQHRAQIAGRDVATDLALLKVSAPEPLPYVRWGDSDAVRVGDWVVVIGNPFGLDDTVSSGIVSARGRDIHTGPYDDFLQIDASINRGNSGGPAFDLDGRVIGINTAIYSPNGGSVGIGFAIPANLARPVVEQLLQRGRVERGWLGVQIQPVTADIARAFRLPGVEGALVAGFSPQGPAARAGFAQGDVILAVNGRTIERMRELPLVVADAPIGRTVEVEVWRGGREITLRPVIGMMPEAPQIAELEAPPAAAETPPGDIAAQLKLARLTPQLRRRLRIASKANGVAVTAIAGDGPLSGIDLAPGDVIEKIDQEPVVSPREAYARLRAAEHARSTVTILVNRRGSDHYVALSLGDRPASDDQG